MKCFQRVGVAICRSVQSVKAAQPRPFHCTNVQSLHSTAVRRGIAEFFPNVTQAAKGETKPKGNKVEDFQDERFESTFGRSWEMSDLETLRNPTLHALWFVLLKERNKMLTADDYFRATLKRRNPYRDQLKSVQQSMDNLKQVMEAREHTVTVVKHKAWLNKVSAHLGQDFAQDLLCTYLQYNSPTCEEEKRRMRDFKKSQLFSPNNERYHQPYEMWDLQLAKKKEDKVKTVVQYEHDIKKQDMDYQYYNPLLWKRERRVREKARRNIVKRMREKFAKRTKSIRSRRKRNNPFIRPVKKDKNNFDSLLEDKTPSQ